MIGGESKNVHLYKIQHTHAPALCCGHAAKMRTAAVGPGSLIVATAGTLMLMIAQLSRQILGVPVRIDVRSRVSPRVSPSKERRGCAHLFKNPHHVSLPLPTMHASACTHSPTDAREMRVQFVFGAAKHACSSCNDLTKGTHFALNTHFALRAPLVAGALHALRVRAAPITAEEERERWIQPATGLTTRGHAGHVGAASPASFQKRLKYWFLRREKMAPFTVTITGLGNDGHPPQASLPPAPHRHADGCRRSLLPAPWALLCTALTLLLLP